jgi:hypothetical protein
MPVDGKDDWSAYDPVSLRQTQPQLSVHRILESLVDEAFVEGGSTDESCRLHYEVMDFQEMPGKRRSPVKMKKLIVATNQG